MQPCIVLTRPTLQSAAFADNLVAAYGDGLPILRAPLMKIDPVAPADPIGSPAHVIFTSINGVAQADRLAVSRSASAWCVGVQTATAARESGFEVEEAGGTSAALVERMLAARPTGEILHLRGAHVTGKVVETLQDAGLRCTARVVYDQVAVPPSGALRDAVAGDVPLIVPLFSPRSARLFSAIGGFHAPLHCIAMSAAVAESIAIPPVNEVITLEFPDKNEMIAATLRVFDALSQGNTP